MKLKLAQLFTKDERMSYVGGSEIAILFGYGNKTVYQLWEEKTGRKAPADLSNNKKVQMGKLSEDFIAGLYQYHNPDKKLRVTQKDYKHPKYPFCCGHIDRLITKSDTILECKNTGEFNSFKWENNQLPQEHILQANYNMGLTKKNETIVVGLIGGWNYQEREVIYDEDLFNEQVQKVKEFWWHVENDVAPAKTADDFKTSVTNGKIIELYNDGTLDTLSKINTFDTLVAYYMQLTGEETSIKNEKKEKANMLKELILDNDGIATESYIVTYPSSETKKFDEKTFAIEHKKLYEKYLRTTISRKINVKKNKKFETA